MGDNRWTDWEFSFLGNGDTMAKPSGDIPGVEWWDEYSWWDHRDVRFFILLVTEAKIFLFTANRRGGAWACGNADTRAIREFY